METAISHASDPTASFQHVWLYEYDLNDVKDWNKLQKAASRIMLGETPHLSIVVFGLEFEVEKKGPSWIVHGSVKQSELQSLNSIIN